MDNVNDVFLERILRHCQPAELIAAQLTCRHWSHVVNAWQLWRPHALAAAGKPAEPAAAGSAGNDLPPVALRPLQQQPDWRRLYIDRMAANRWHSGKLVLSATLYGHTGPITCIATMDDVILTGSQDKTARLWLVRPQQQQQQYVLQHDAPVAAVAVVSVDLSVTAAAATAYLWRRGQAIRRFDVMPGGAIRCLCLTDTQLLLGTTAGTVQQFDLYSGTQQLITRHHTAVTALLAYQPQQYQQQVEDEQSRWCVIVGFTDGWVTCISCNTGQQVWQLGVTHYAAIKGLSIRQYGLTQQQQQQQRQFLVVLNARAQLLLWDLPDSKVDKTPMVPAAYWPVTSTQILTWHTKCIFRVADDQQQAVSFAVPEFGTSNLLLVSDGRLTVFQCALTKAAEERLAALPMQPVAESSVATSDTTAAAAVAIGSEEASHQRQDVSDSNPQQQQQQQQQDQQQHVNASAIRDGSGAGRSSSSSSSGRRVGRDICLKSVRCCDLSKLAKLIRERKSSASNASPPSAAATATTARDKVNLNRNSTGRGPAAAYGSLSSAVGAMAVSPVPAATVVGGQGADVDMDVTCVMFTATGQLVVGLASGHACLLKLKQQGQQQQ